MSTLPPATQRSAPVHRAAPDIPQIVAPDDLRELGDFEDWEKMDWPLRFPLRDRDWPYYHEGISPPEPNSLRLRWLADHDVHTEFLDAGFGCCWFAQQGEQEPVSGETEYDAIVRLARENGLELWETGRGRFPR